MLESQRIGGVAERLKAARSCDRASTRIMPAESDDSVLTPKRGSEVRQVIRPGAQSNDWANHKYMTYVYFLKLSNGDLYKGLTSDLKRRMEEHATGKVESTKNYLPAILIGYEAYQLKSDAQRREKFLKTTEGRRLLKQQYKDILSK